MITHNFIRTTKKSPLDWPAVLAEGARLCSRRHFVQQRTFIPDEDRFRPGNGSYQAMSPITVDPGTCTIHTLTPELSAAGPRTRPFPAPWG